MTVMHIWTAALSVAVAALAGWVLVLSSTVSSQSGALGRCQCADCGAELESGWHADHQRPLSRGGETDVINWQALCPTCNRRKGSNLTELRAEGGPVTYWEYRTVTIHEDRPGYKADEDIGQRLTNLARPETHEHDYAGGWEIFTIRPLDDGTVRLYMKRPAASKDSHDQ